MVLMDLEPCLPKRFQYSQKNIEFFGYSLFLEYAIFWNTSFKWRMLEDSILDFPSISFITRQVFFESPLNFQKKFSINVFLWYSFYGLKTFWSFSCKFCFFFDDFTIPLVIQGFRSFLFWFSALILETICLKE